MIRKFDLIEGRDWKLEPCFPKSDMKIVVFLDNDVMSYARDVTQVKGGWRTYRTTFVDLEEAIEHSAQTAYDEIEAELKEFKRIQDAFRRRSVVDITMDAVRKDIDNMTDERRAELVEFFRDDSPRGWIRLVQNGHLPGMRAVDRGSFGSPYLVRNAAGEEWWSHVCDHMTWQYSALSQGVTDWYNPSDEEFESHMERYRQSVSGK
jgi:hypothetical protein